MYISGAKLHPRKQDFRDTQHNRDITQNRHAEHGLQHRANVSESAVSIASPIVVLTIILAIIFIVLLVILIVLLGKKPEKQEEFGESYY